MDFNILGGAAQWNPNAFSGAFNQAQQLQMQQRQQEQQQQQLQLRMDLATRAAQGDTEAFAQLNALDPQNQKAWENTWSTASTAQQNEAKKFVSSLIGTAGNVEQQDSILDSRIAALENAGNDPEQLQVLKAIRQTPPDARAPIVESMGFRVFGAEELGKLRDMQRKEAAFPVEQRQAQANVLSTELKNMALPEQQRAEILKTYAEIKRMNAQSDLDYGRLNLDIDKALLDQVKSNQVEVKGEALKRQFDSVDAGLKAASLADNADKLSKQFAEMKSWGGYPTRATAAVKKFMGIDDPAAFVKQEADRLVKSGALQMLPPGSASDADVRMVLEGFPDVNSTSSAQMAKWMAAFARVQRGVAKVEEARAAWIGATGGIGAVNRDIELQGRTVPAGTTFEGYMRQSGQAPKPQAGYLKYGS